MYQEELKLAEQIEDLGYDSHWCVEHHFQDYASCPDNVVYLSSNGRVIFGMGGGLSRREHNQFGIYEHLARALALGVGCMTCSSRLSQRVRSPTTS